MGFYSFMPQSEKLMRMAFEYDDEQVIKYLESNKGKLISRYIMAIIERARYSEKGYRNADAQIDLQELINLRPDKVLDYVEFIKHCWLKQDEIYG